MQVQHGKPQVFWLCTSSGTLWNGLGVMWIPCFILSRQSMQDALSKFTTAMACWDLDRPNISLCCIPPLSFPWEKGRGWLHVNGREHQILASSGTSACDPVCALHCHCTPSYRSWTHQQKQTNKQNSLPRGVFFICFKASPGLCSRISSHFPLMPQLLPGREATLLPEASVWKAFSDLYHGRGITGQSDP